MKQSGRTLHFKKKAASSLFPLIALILACSLLPFSECSSFAVVKREKLDEFSQNAEFVPQCEKKFQNTASKKGEFSSIYVVPGGTPFGVRLCTKGAILCKMEDKSPLKEQGLLLGDILISYNGETVDTLYTLEKLMKKSDKVRDRVQFMRLHEVKTVEVTKKRDEKGEFTLLASFKDAVAGIGTVTFYDENTMKFAGLGHGICEEHRGTLLPLLKGTVLDVHLTSLVKGETGHPGQLGGLFESENKGVLVSNTRVGVFGSFYSKMNSDSMQKKVRTALPGEVKEGKAEILCTLPGEKTRLYEVEIERIYSFTEEGKNYLIHVKDRQLLSLAGGIVQGMSGSPILQNGRLVGAVTHVLVEDPTRGYGIYIGKMVDKL